MDSDPYSPYFLAVAICFYLFSVLFSIIKIVFTSYDKSAVSPDQERLRAYGTKIETILEDRLGFASIVSFGHTFSNVGFGLTIYQYILPWYSESGWFMPLAVAYAIAVIILTLCAYFMPRAFARRFGLALLPFAYNSFALVNWLFKPIVVPMVWIYGLLLKVLKYDERFAFLSAEEQSRLQEHGGEPEQRLDEEEREMIHSIFELGETTVEEIMVPRVDIKGLALDTDLETVLNRVREEGHSRLPVFKDTIDSIVGMLYVKDVLSWLSQHEPEEWNLQALIKRVHFVPGQKKIDDLMAEFKAKHLHISVVVDEYGGTAGLVTMEDILEEIVGDIQDEYDNEEKAVVVIGENVFLVDPQIDLYDLNEELDIHLDTEDIEYNTLGGLIYHEHGDIPKVNTIVDYNGLHITVLEMDNQRIQRAKVEVTRQKQVENAS